MRRLVFSGSASSRSLISRNVASFSPSAWHGHSRKRHPLISFTWIELLTIWAAVPVFLVITKRSSSDTTSLYSENRSSWP